jgi:hypothetical protein
MMRGEKSKEKTPEEIFIYLYSYQDKSGAQNKQSEGQ